MISKIVCFGGAHVDVKAFSHFSVMFGEKNPVTSKRSFGGVARNIAENLSRLHMSVSLFSRVGADELGQSVLNAIKEHGIESSHISMSDKYPTATYTALLEPNGSLAVALSDMAIYDEICCEKEELTSFSSASIWLIDANLPVSALEKLARFCPKQTKLWAVGVSVPKNQRFMSIIERIDLMIINQQEYLEFKSVKKPKHILMTQGKQGAVLFSEYGIEQYSAFDCNVVDVTGAGDGFTSGLIYGYLKTGELSNAVPFAMATAKLSLETDNTVSKLINEKVINNYAKKYINKFKTCDN